MFVFPGEEGRARCLFPTSDLSWSSRKGRCHVPLVKQPLLEWLSFFLLIGSWSAPAHSLERDLQLLGWFLSAESVGLRTPLSWRLSAGCLLCELGKDPGLSGHQLP